ncbi:MAG: TetR/AcrR family transcriptional regulator [Thermoguttaceae bacterium]
MPRSSPQMPKLLAQTAFELFSERGFDEVAIDQIAARAGVTKGSFYSHYRSKQEIILAACQYYYQTYQQKVHRAIAPLTDSMERLRRVLELAVRTCVIDRPTRVFTTEIFALSLKDPQVRSGWLQFYNTVREMYIGLVVAATAAGQMEVADPRAAVNLMLATIEGVKLRAVFEPEIGDEAEQQAIVEGLLTVLAGGGHGGKAVPAVRKRKAASA